MKSRHAALIVTFALGLSACQGENKGEDQRTAVGEILPASVSDEMVPYDKLRSQPPLAPATGSAGAGKNKGEGEADTPDATATDSEASNEPAESAPPDVPEPAAQ